MMQKHRDDMAERSQKGRTILTETCDAPQRADVFVRTFCEKSRSALRAMFQQDCVTVNGQRCTDPGKQLAVGDKVVVSFDPKKKYREQSERYKSRLFRPLFEDNYLIVVEKAAGFLSVPSETEDQSLLASVNKYISVKSGRPQGATLVHRLDRDTSGILVLAKHPNLADTLKEQFASRKPYRKYFAITKFGPKVTRGTYRSYLATDEDLNQFSTTAEKGKLAITHFRVVKRFTDCSLIHVELETGRRNQIRVHFAEHGHPVIGDVRYRPGMAMHERWAHKRLALHAAELHFIHPVTKKQLKFSSPMPVEMEEFIAGSTLKPPPDRRFEKQPAVDRSRKSSREKFMERRARRKPSTQKVRKGPGPKSKKAAERPQRRK